MTTTKEAPLFSNAEIDRNTILENEKSEPQHKNTAGQKDTTSETREDNCADLLHGRLFSLDAMRSREGYAGHQHVRSDEAQNASC